MLENYQALSIYRSGLHLGAGAVPEAQPVGEFSGARQDEGEAHQIKFAIGWLEAAQAEKGYAPR
jgi:hypothetical protein